MQGAQRQCSDRRRVSNKRRFSIKACPHLFAKQDNLYPETKTLYPETETLYPETATLYPETGYDVIVQCTA